VGGNTSRQAYYLIMATQQPRKIQFINLSHPADASATESQRSAHSHAARAAHASTRRLRILEYRIRKASQQSEECRDHDGAGSSKEAVPSTVAAAKSSSLIRVEADVVPSPVNLLASDRRDPFMSSARPLESIEHYLLDHCK
jgi:hypothetical protein